MIQSNFEYFFEIMGKTTITTENYKCVLSEVPDPCFNSILSTNTTPQTVESLITEMAERYEKQKQNHCWWFNELTQPQTLPDILTQYGYTTGEQFMGLSYDLSQYEVSEIDDEDFMVLQLTNPEQLNYWIYPFLEHNNYKNLVSRKIYERYTALFDSNRHMHHLVVFHKELPVGCGSLLIKDNHAGLYNVGFVAKTHQAKIIQLLQKARLNVAKQNNCDYIVMQLPEAIYKKGYYNSFQPQMIYRTFIKHL